MGVAMTTDECLDLVIEYYEGKLPLSAWRVTDWEIDHPCDDKVVFVVLTEYRNGKKYVINICGSDYYCLDGSDLFCWVDPKQPWASKERVGSVYSENECVDFAHVPRLSSKIRKGIMVPDSHAIELGLM